MAQISITLGNNVYLGGNVKIYDTDFHPLDFKQRIYTNNPGKALPITLSDNVFVGAHTIILKGVTIGQNSIIWAGSVVTKSIPANEIWGGVPAKFIRKIDNR